MTPEMAFSHPFISKAVNELKCLRTGSQGNGNASPDDNKPGAQDGGASRNAMGTGRTGKANQQ